MKKVGIIGLLAASLAVIAATTSLATVANSKPACGGVLWRMTTLSDRDRGKVLLAPRPTTIAAIVERGMPHPLPRRRTTPFQKQTWQVVAQITDYRLVKDVLHLTLSDNKAYIDAAIPAPSCLPSTARARSAIIRAWTAFTANCGHPTNHPQPLGAVAYVNGVGSWNLSADTRRLAPNGAALSPVTGFRFVAGCGI